jgi:leucyl-tRNA synthetase
MNGRLHLGHAFTLSKAEFMAGYQRMLGKRVLFPFAFHGTGMPIKSCADRLKRELAMKAKSDSKNIKQAESSQISILKAMGIGEAELPRFTDAEYWLKYFPPLAKVH